MPRSPWLPPGQHAPGSCTVPSLDAARRRRPPTGTGSDDLFFVFVVPCLNEELVVGTSIDRLLALPGDRFAVLVIDDGSTDGTAEAVRSRLSDRVWLLQRRPPEARRGPD